MQSRSDETRPNRWAPILLGLALAGGSIVNTIPSLNIDVAWAGTIDPSLEARARNGDPEAQFQLGDKYIKGDGTPKDFAKGVQWLTAAADNRHGQAQLSLGILYFYGWGVSVDAATAKSWLEKAAANGVTEADYYLEKPELRAIAGTAPQAGQFVPSPNDRGVTSTVATPARQHAVQRTSNAFDLRGIQLGISLAEFKALPYPDQKPNVPARAFCTGDPVPERSYIRMDVYDTDKAIGIIKCNHFDFKKSYAESTIPPAWREATLRVATIETYMTYEFIPDATPQRTPRLFRISVRSNVRYWDTFWRGFTAKYGPPEKKIDGTVQNRMGAVFDDVTVTWRNAESSITMFKRVGRIDATSIIYEHTALARLATTLEERITGKPGENL